jgi:hypothetical protein
VQDELLWAAAWLHLASSPSPSSQSKYMSYISTNGGNLGGEQDDYTISWDDKRVATKVLLSKVLDYTGGHGHAGRPLHR